MDVNPLEGVEGFSCFLSPQCLERYCIISTLQKMARQPLKSLAALFQIQFLLNYHILLFVVAYHQICCTSQRVKRSKKPATIVSSTSCWCITLCDLHAYDKRDSSI